MATSTTANKDSSQTSEYALKQQPPAIAKSLLSFTNGTSSSSTQEESRKHRVHSYPYPEQRHAALSRTALVKSEGLLKAFADTPPTAPSSPRINPYVPFLQFKVPF